MKVVWRAAALVLFAGMLVFLSCRAQTGVRSPAANGGPPGEMVLPASKAGPVVFPRNAGNPPAAQPQQAYPPPQAPSQSVP